MLNEGVELRRLVDAKFVPDADGEVPLFPELEDGAIGVEKSILAAAAALERLPRKPEPEAFGLLS